MCLDNTVGEQKRSCACVVSFRVFRNMYNVTVFSDIGQSHKNVLSCSQGLACFRSPINEHTLSKVNHVIFTFSGHYNYTTLE